MKVRYIKDLPDESVAPGYVFRAGWTAEHIDSVAEERIAAGFCERCEDQSARARKLEATAEIEVECIPTAPEMPSNRGRATNK